MPEARLRSPEAVARGQVLYTTNCILCHGERGDGHGTRSTGLSTAPANFTDPGWRGRTSARRVFFAVKEGVRGTAMPAWKGTLDDDEVWDLAAFVLSLAYGAPRTAHSARASHAS